MVHYEIRSGDMLIYSSFRLNEDFAATNIKLSEEINKVPTLTFDLPPNNNINLEVMSTMIEMYRNDNMIFRGRVTQRKKKFDKSISYTVEGDLGFLHDILVRPSDYGSRDIVEYDYFEAFFGANGIYNRRASRPFVRGINDGDTSIMVDPYTVHLPENTNYPDCFNELTENLDIYNGGYIKTRHEKSGNTWTHYIDFVKAPLPSGSQKIVYAQNILDINNDDDGRDIVTHFIPLGKTVDKARTTLTGYDYLENASGVNTYGVIEKTEDYSEVENETTLREYAEHDFGALGIKSKKNAVKIKAIDMSIIGDDAPLEVGYVYEVYSYPHGIEFLPPSPPSGEDHRKQLQRYEIDPNNPDKCVYWFGDIPKDSMRRIQADRARQEEIRQRVLEEASYTNAISAESSGSSGKTYSTQSGGSVTTGGNDLTTTSGYNSGGGSSWDQVKLFDESASGTLELDPSTINLDVSGLSVDLNTGAVGGSISVSGKIYLEIADLIPLLNQNLQLYKNTSSVTVGKSVNNAAVIASAKDTTSNVLGCSVAGMSGDTVDVTMFAIGQGSDINASAIAIGTD